MAGLLIKCSEISASAPYADFLINGALKKVHLTWTESVIRGIGCNVMVCLAVWCVTVVSLPGSIQPEPPTSHPTLLLASTQS